MREFINIHVGQAGVQLGNACWEVSACTNALQSHMLSANTACRKCFCREHGISKTGTLADSGGRYKTFFSEHAAGLLEPRCLMVDLDPASLEKLRASDCRQLYRVEQLIAGREDATGLFARGCYSVGKELVDRVMDRVRHMAENCSQLRGLLVYRSIGGGTGSGLGSRG